MDIEQLKQRFSEPSYQRWLLIFANIILWFIILMLIVNNVQEFWFSNPSTAILSTQKHQYTGPSAEVIPNLHLFGSAATNLSDLPLASLGLQVNGIFLSNDLKKSRALISMTGQSPQMYNIGDALPGGVKIFKIMRDSVIVSHNGRLEKLPFALQGVNFSQTSDTQGLFNT